MVWGGTGANNVALASNARAGAGRRLHRGLPHQRGRDRRAERILGAKLIDVPTEDGKLRPEQVEALRTRSASSTTPSPASCRSPSRRELGTLYSADEIGALADVAHSHGMTVHMDGRPHRQRAAVALRRMDVRSFTVDVGVDVISFGGTKNGMMYGGAVVYLNARWPAPPLPAQAGDAAAVEDAVRLRPVHRAA